jgi:hypothetical protein
MASAMGRAGPPPGESAVVRDSFGDEALLGRRAAKRTSMSIRMILISTNNSPTIVTIATTASPSHTAD